MMLTETTQLCSCQCLLVVWNGFQF